MNEPTIPAQTPPAPATGSGWIGVDLDGTLAHYEGWKGTHNIGAPIRLMVERVKGWLAAGKRVKIFTARMHGHGMPLIGGGVEDVRTPIEAWCKEHLGAVLEITNVKDFGMIELWDDRAIQVEANTGIPVVEEAAARTKSAIRYVGTGTRGPHVIYLAEGKRITIGRDKTSKGPAWLVIEDTPVVRAMAPNTKASDATHE
jgi:hypothetical protein